MLRFVLGKVFQTSFVLLIVSVATFGLLKLAPGAVAGVSSMA